MDILTVISYSQLPIEIAGINVLTIKKTDNIIDIISLVESKYILLNLEDNLVVETLNNVVGKLASNNTDILLFPGYRIDGSFIWNQALYLNNLSSTTLSQFPQAIIDNSISNKIFNREFLIDNNIKFSDSSYSKELFVSEALLKSRNISIEKNVLTIFSTSTKQLNIKDLTDVLMVFKRIESIIKRAKTNSSLILKHWLLKLLNSDLSDYIDDLLKYDEEEQSLITKTVKNFLADIDIPFDTLNSFNRLKYYFIINENKEALRYLLSFYNGLGSFHEGKIYDDFYLYLTSLNIDLDFFEKTEEINLEFKLEELKVLNSHLYIKGWGYIPFIDQYKEDDLVKELIFKGNSQVFKYNLKSNYREDLLLKGFGVNFYDYAGFEEIINLNEVIEDCDVYLRLSSENVAKQTFLFKYKTSEKKLIKQLNLEETTIINDPTPLPIITCNINGSLLTMDLANDLYFENIDLQSTINTRLVFINNVTNRSFSASISNVSTPIFGKRLVKESNDLFKEYDKLLNIGVYLDKVIVNAHGSFQLFLEVEFKAMKKLIPLKIVSSIGETNSNIYSAIKDADNGQLTIFVNNSVHEPNNNTSNVPDKQLINENNKLKKELNIYKHRLNYMENSFSWRITKIIRMLYRKNVKNK